MLSILYVSVMMCIFYIDWQHYWKCDWILNISANAHGKQTVSTKQPQHKWQTWQSGFQWHRRPVIELVLGTRLFHSATVSQCDHFWMLHVFVVWNFTRFFFFGGGGGELSFNVFTTRWHILISRPPRVFRRSCIFTNGFEMMHKAWHSMEEVCRGTKMHISRCFGTPQQCAHRSM